MVGRRVPFDATGYAARVAAGCFVCRMLAGDREYEHSMVFEDPEHVVFLNRYPTTLGQLLVAPRRHVEHLSRDLDEDSYVALQRIVHRTARALERVVASERVYVASLGSQQGNSHLHVHVAALPPGTPAEAQQLAALDAERSGVLRVPHAETERIASELCRLLA